MHRFPFRSLCSCSWTRTLHPLFCPWRKKKKNCCCSTAFFSVFSSVIGAMIQWLFSQPIIFSLESLLVSVNCLPPCDFQIIQEKCQCLKYLLDDIVKSYPRTNVHDDKPVIILRRARVVGKSFASYCFHVSF